MLPGKATAAAMKSRTRCQVVILDTLRYSDGSTSLPKMSFTIEQPKYTVCRHCKKTEKQAFKPD